jgi:hypothetical protein
MITVLRPLSTSELLDRAFHLYRNNFLVFVGITAIPQLAVLALQLGSAAMISQHFVTGFLATTIVAALINVLALEVSQAAAVVAVSSLHLDKPASIGSAYSVAKGSLLRVVWISFVVFLVVAGIFGAAVGIAAGVRAAMGPVVGLLGFLALIPAAVLVIYLSLAWSLAVPATMLEGGGFTVSTRRSAFLTKSGRGRIFGVLFLMGIFGAIVAMVLQFAFVLPVRLLGLHDRFTVQAVTQALTACSAFLSNSLIGALGTIALTLIYYDHRVRKEGFDLQLMMSALESTGPGDAASPSPASAGI